MLNTPWTESPFFKSLLSKRPHLSQEEQSQASFFHENGYLILKGAVDERLIDAVRNDLETKLKTNFTPGNPRVAQQWKFSDNIKELACNDTVLAKLKMLYEREPIPFQTLNFSHGSKQKPHSDTIHFSSFPERYMCAAWVALEDMDEENGTVVYYPGSHKLPLYDYADISKEFSPLNNLPEKFYAHHYEPFISKLMEAHGFVPKKLIIKKGDILIWSANLIHGGLPVIDQSRTRWSQVTHYFFEDCLYYTPQNSNRPGGEWFLRRIQNIKTGELLDGSYNGYKVNRKVLPGPKHLISDYATKDWRDLLFFFTKAYYKLFKRPF